MNHCTVTCRERHYFDQCPHEIEGLIRSVQDPKRIERQLPAHRNFDLMEEFDRQLKELEEE